VLIDCTSAWHVEQEDDAERQAWTRLEVAKEALRGRQFTWDDCLQRTSAREALWQCFDGEDHPRDMFWFLRHCSCLSCPVLRPVAAGEV
jgi:hypothetical protein